jgi:hypothetical protein
MAASDDWCHPIDLHTCPLHEHSVATVGELLDQRRRCAACRERAYQSAVGPSSPLKFGIEPDQIPEDPGEPPDDVQADGEHPAPALVVAVLNGGDDLKADALASLLRHLDLCVSCGVEVEALRRFQKRRIAFD